MRLAASLLAFFIVGTVLAVMLGCASSKSAPSSVFGQEPIAAVLYTLDGNRVSFGSSVDPARWSKALVAIEAATLGRLPAVEFEVYAYPIVLGNGVTCHSFRAPSRNLIVLSHWVDSSGAWTVGDVDWEVSHFLAGTDDQGRPWRGM